MKTERIGASLGEDERDATLTFDLHGAEKQTWTYPGCPAHAELVSATFDDDGSEVPGDLLADTEDWEREAFAQRDDRDSAMAEDAADKRREDRRERRLCRT